MTVQQVETQGEHFSEAGLGEAGALRFLADRFAGRPPVNTCQVSPAPTKPCTSRRFVRVRVLAPGRARIVAARATVNGKRVALRRAGRRRIVRVRLAGRPPEPVRVRIVVRTSTGARRVVKRTFRPCGKGVLSPRGRPGEQAVG